MNNHTYKKFKQSCRINFHLNNQFKQDNLKIIDSNPTITFLDQIYQQMKTLENPTTFFFKQAESITEKPSPQIQDFVNKLINKDQCQLCKQNYDILLRIPRIMIHCGHTFCTPCLRQFYMQLFAKSRNRRVRCPMCLKLVKQLDSLQRLPINHTIFTHLVQKDKQICKKTSIKPIIQDAGKFLFAEFQKAQKQAHMKDKPQKIDPDSGLPFCVFHPDRVEHFYCAVHSSAGCRVCSQIGHSKPQCKVIDLYQIDDPNQLQQIIGKSRIQNHAESNQHQQQETSSQENDQNEENDPKIILDEQTGMRYLKTKAGRLLPLLNQNQNEEEYFNEEYLNGSGIQQLNGNYEVESDDE